MTASPVKSSNRIDRLAELEEERRYLLRSLKDLERERQAGDVDDDDYRTLKDGYTVRAAAVLRQIDDGRRALRPRRRRDWKRTTLVAVVAAVCSAGIGFALAGAFGERLPLMSDSCEWCPVPWLQRSRPNTRFWPSAANQLGSRATTSGSEQPPK